MSQLQRKMQEKLSGGKFRWINEQLYTTDSKQAKRMFKEDKSLFTEYHVGFHQQVQSWPLNPVDVIIEELRKVIDDRSLIGDFGCGDAKIAKTFTKNKIYSYDFVSNCKEVVACDISKLPLKNDFLDFAVFSLSLMGTNYIQFLTEANRVLKNGGILKIAEVNSRMVDGFDAMLLDLGFSQIDKELKNDFFVFYTLKKCSAVKSIKKIDLKPCIYKKR